MAEEFGDFGTPPPPGGPPSGSPLPSDAEAAKKAAESMKDLTEKVKDLKTKTEVAVERIMDLSKEGFRLNESLRKNYEDMKKLEEKRKLGLKLTDDEIKREKELAVLQNKEKEELKKVGEALVKLRDSLESTEEVQYHANESLKTLADAFDDFADGLPRELSELEKELKPITEGLKADGTALEEFGDSIRGMAKALPSFKDSLKAGFALGVGKLIPLIADSFGKGTKASPLNLEGLFGKKEPKRNEVVLSIEELIKETQKTTSEIWVLGDVFKTNLGVVDTTIKSVGVSIQEWINLLADTISSTQKDIKAVLVSTRSSGGMTAVVEGGGDLVAEFLNMLVDEVKELHKIANVVVTNTSEMTKALGEMKDALIDAVIAQQESALEISEKERASPAGATEPAGEPSKPGEKAEAKPPEKSGVMGNFLNAAKQGAQAMLMIAGSLLVLAVGLKLMKEIDPGTLLKAGVAMSALGGGLYLLAKIPAADLKKAAESMLLVAASVSVLAIGMMLMKNVGAEGFIKTAIGLTAMVGVLQLLSKVDSSKLMKSAMSLALVGASLIPLAVGMMLMTKVNAGAMLKTGVAILGLMGVLYGISKINTASLIRGALGIAILGASLLPLSLGLLAMNFVNWESVGKMGASLVGLAIAAGVLGSMSALILPGALAIAVLGASLIPLALALMMFNAVGWESLAVAGAAIVGFALVFAGIGFMSLFIAAGAAAMAVLGVGLMSLGAGLSIINSVGMGSIPSLSVGIMELATTMAIVGAMSPLLVLASAAMTIMAVALVALSFSLAIATPGILMFAGAMAVVQASGTMDILSQIADIGMNGVQIAAGLVATAVGIGAVGAALLAFGAMGAAGQVTGAIGDAVSGVLGFFTGKKAPSPIEMLGMFVGFAEMAPKINEGAMAINALADALQRFSNTKFGEMLGLDKIGSLVDKIGSTEPGVFDKLKSMGQSLMAFATAQPPPLTAPKARGSTVEYGGEEYLLPAAKEGTPLASNLSFTNGVLTTKGVSTETLIAEANLEKRDMEKSEGIERELSEDLLRQILGELRSRGEIQPVVVNNTNSTQMAAPPSGGGGGATMIPLYSGSHTDATKMAYQVSYRPAG